MGRAPDSLDPARGYTRQAFEVDWLVYTPLLTYAHAAGTPGTQLIPALATAVPTVTDGGRSYALTLRSGLRYSNGEPVVASDFTRAVERTIRLRWGGARRFITDRIVGAAAFAAGRSRGISGITTDDGTGQITIRLTRAFGAFENALAFPALAPVPRGTPTTPQGIHPPSGVGPYVIRDVVSGRSFSLIRNPQWPEAGIPGIPAGHLDFQVEVSTDPRTNAFRVLHDDADVFDSAQQIPASVVAQVERTAPRRASLKAVNTTYLIFLNVTRPPFSSPLARQAVLVALGDDTVTRMPGSALLAGCYLLPPSTVGHPTARCPYGAPGGGNPAAARSLVERSGMSASHVTVWSNSTPQVHAWMTYYTTLLDRIGLRAIQRVVPSTRYFSIIGRAGLHPQTGFGVFREDVPDPAEPYRELLDGTAIVPSGNVNWGEVDDARVNAELGMLAAVPASKLAAVAGFWRALDEYVARQAYVAVLGYQALPKLLSRRIDYSSAVFSPVAGLDWSSLRLK